MHSFTCEYIVVPLPFGCTPHFICIGQLVNHVLGKQKLADSLSPQLDVTRGHSRQRNICIAI